AATDMLLLMHGHRCEEAGGMCCLTLSDHATSMHARVQTLQDLTHPLRVDGDWTPFGRW
ncbi:hypothetical protein N309_07040, partial [Tinamus guttatus]